METRVRPRIEMEIPEVGHAIAFWRDVEDLLHEKLDDYRRLCDAAPAVDDEVPVHVVAYVASRHQVLEPILAE
jgi:hypothetical protein